MIILKNGKIDAGVDHWKHKTVAQKLRDLAKEALVDEIMIVDFYGKQEGRLKAYDLLAKEFLHSTLN